MFHIIRKNIKFLKKQTENNDKNELESISS